jgi:predicted permease
MIRNYLNIALRNLLRNKVFSLINILGLSIGMASAVLILLWIGNQLSHDRFHANIDRIYTLNNRDRFNGELQAWNNTPKILAPTIKQDYPEVEEAVRVNGTSFLFTYGDKKLNVQGNFVDPAFLTVFSLPLVKGNSGKALDGTYNLVVTEKLAIKLFGQEEPMGKVIQIGSTDHFTVTGVLKDLPNNTDFSFEYLMPWAYMTKLGWDDKSWGNNSVHSYVLLKPGVSQAAFDAKIKNVTIDHTKDSDKVKTQVFTHRFSDAYLYSKSENGRYAGGRIEVVNLFAVIATFILLIACINFMNLSTARSQKRAKEVGIRKVVGATKGALVRQFLGESILLAFLAGIVALLLVEFSLPAFNGLVGKRLYIDFADPLFWMASLFFVVFTGVVAGVYPAFFLSAFQPVKVLKGAIAQGTSKAVRTLVAPRKVLVVLQFTFAIVLIICTIIITRQINHAQQRNSGYDQNQLVFVHLQGDIEKHYQTIKSELLNSGAAIAVNKSMSPITQRYSDGWGFSWTGSTEEDEKTDFVRMATDVDFVPTMGVTLLEGRDIDIKQYPSDSTAILLNEAAVKAMRFKDPVGQLVREGDREWHVVGVLKDFVYQSPYQKVQQLIVFGPASWFGVMHIRLNSSNPVAQNLQLAGRVFKQFNPAYPFEYKFADEEYARKFDDEKKFGQLVAVFAGLTIFISCLGLFGLATYMAQNRTKEIGVRRVLGASVNSIATLLSKDFLKLVVIALLVATPLAWWVMSGWLQLYEYRVAIEWWVFAVAGGASVLIALLTVSYQAIKAATANPVKSLRTE